jgi:hypothetical protein
MTFSLPTKFWPEISVFVEYFVKELFFPPDYVATIACGLSPD